MEKLQRKFGKKPPKRDDRTLKFANYLVATALPPLPDTVSWQTKMPADSGEMGNDTIGDCTCASAGHMIMNWTVNTTGTSKVISDSQIINAYSAITGYNPQTGANDNGAQCLDVLNYWRHSGIGGDQISSYVELECGQPEQIRQAIFLFGGCYSGFAMPNFIANGPDLDTWDVPATGASGDGAPNQDNGHAVPLLGYDPNFIYCVTWGEIKPMTWNFFTTYADEAYAVLSNIDWFANGQNPDGFDLQSLQTDLQQIDPGATVTT